MPAPDWKGRGDTWRRGSTTLTWGTGTPPQKRVAYVTREVRRAGEPPTPPEPPAGSETRQFNERIDGRDAKLFRDRFQGTYYVGADWDSQVTWIRAETTSSDAADLVLNIARTVRFMTK
jgi:hypothetical protein